MTTPKTRPFVRYVAIALAFLFMPILVLGATVAATGTVSVRIHDEVEDLDLWIPVPALLIDLAVVVAPLAMPEETRDEIRAEIGPYRDGLEALARELADCPDGLLVEVSSPDEHVEVTKRGGKLEIGVASDGSNVSVSVPARILGRALDVV